MKKILIVSTMGRQFFLFESVNIKVLKEMGYEVHGAANLSDDDPARLDAVDITKHHIDIQRSPLAPRNVTAYRQLLNLMRAEQFEAVHCHAPMGGVIGRLAAHAAKVPHVAYTAHGFHFYRGAPFLNWLFYYPAEALLSNITDLLITINSEDHAAARRLFAGRVARVPGVGVEVAAFDHASVARSSIRDELGLSPHSVVLVSVGELIRRKNHETTLRAMRRLSNSDTHLLICGRGQENDALRRLAFELELGNRVHFLGYRSDMSRVLAAADIYISASLQEGLPVAGIEAMASGLPMICSRVRGNRDLLEEGVNGLGFEPRDEAALSQCVNALVERPSERARMGEQSRQRARTFDRTGVEAEMRKVYALLLA